MDLNEKYKVLGRTVINKYNFKTRYSMLEVLDSKLGGMGLPGKKFSATKVLHSWRKERLISRAT